jgi:hypothetical protein
LVGRWRSEGQTVATPTEPAVQISGTDTYEWLGGGFFLVHRVDVRMGDDRVEALELIGGDYDDASGSFPAHSFDSQGNIVTMRTSVGDDGTLMLANETERATVRFGDNGQSMTAYWERADDGSSWSPWMNMTFTKSS